MATGVTILDGGMGRELERIGAPFRQPEWSALALLEGPDYVGRAHRAFIDAGADVITSNSYAVVPFHIGEARFLARGRALADLAGRIARAAADGAGRKVTVAGSLPPVFGSYRPDLFQPDRAAAILEPLIGGLAPHVDLWLAETQGSLAEVATVRQALREDRRPLWLSFTLDDSDPDAVAAGRVPARLRSGESVGAAAAKAAELGAAALLFNCSQPEVMEAALREATASPRRAGPALSIGVYANAFEPRAADAAANADLSGIRADLGPSSYLAFARRWVAAGASIVGGCCGIGPEHIAALAQDLKPSPLAA
jgi:S-methylmethionine-dependent homocysteine/selenocysteine methylase